MKLWQMQYLFFACRGDKRKDFSIAILSTQTAAPSAAMLRDPLFTTVSLHTHLTKKLNVMQCICILSPLDTTR